MSKIFKDLYTDYFQKSRMFLYPHLGIKRGSKIVPKETYMAWGDITPQQKKLICLYEIQDTIEFSNFEQTKLINNPLFERYIEIENNQALYIFDFSGDHSQDYEFVISGQYSILTHSFKKIIKEFYANSKNTQLYVDSWLNPERYYSEYARILAHSDNSKDIQYVEKILKESVQLCKKPDIDKETLVTVQVNS